MAEPAIRRMTVDEFLRWEDGTGTRYELIDGFVLAMAPPTPRHGAVVLRLGGAINAALRGRPPCAAYGEAGIVRPDRDDTFYVADIAVTCDPLQPDDQLIRNPILIVEILSPARQISIEMRKFPRSRPSRGCNFTAERGSSSIRRRQWKSALVGAAGCSDRRHGGLCCVRSAANQSG